MAKATGLIVFSLVFTGAIIICVAIFRNKLPLKSSYTWRGVMLFGLVALICGDIAAMGSWNVYGPAGLGIFMCWLGLSLLASLLLMKRWKPAPKYEFLDWPLAAVALLGREKKWRLDQLAGVERTDKAQKKARKFLEKQWEITDAESWEETCEWLIETGHRKQFHEEINQLLAYDEAQLAAYLSQIDQGQVETEDGANTHELHARAYWVVEEGFQLLEKSFLAWDLLRMVDVCRWAFLAGWAERAKAEAYLFLAGQALQKRYQSWEALNDAYLNGMRYWSYDAYQQTEPVREKHLTYLRTHKSSPWKRIPWRFELPTPDFGGEELQTFED